MKLYTEEITRGAPGNVSFLTGIEAFYHMGFEIIPVKSLEELIVSKDNIFFGSIGFVQRALKKLNFEIPEHNDYPDSLSKYYGRKITESTMDTISNNPELWNVFVKPKGKLKKFTGRHIKTTTTRYLAYGYIKETGDTNMIIK